MIVGSASPGGRPRCCRRTSPSACRSRWRCSAPRSRSSSYLPRCARGEISAFLLTEPDVGSDPARLGTTAVPSADGSEYVLDGVKLWTTNGVVADLLVVMARVPKGGGAHRGGITAFVVEADADGITVENRNAFMGLRGLENGVTRFHEVRVPAANRIGQEGQGLKIALTTLNTGRLSLPASCAAAGKLALRSPGSGRGERVQWGRPVGEHEAVATKIAFIAATGYALEAVVDLSSQMADDKRSDIRIEAALAKLYCSEMAWQIADELVQIRGGRGYETAASLAARGERGVPAEQMLRDMRINRIFEGSIGDHAPVHRPGGGGRAPVGGRRADRAGLPVGRRARAAAKAGPSTPVAAHAGRRRRASCRAPTREFGPLAHAPAVRGAGEPQAGPRDVLRRWPAGRADWNASRASSAGSSTSARSCSR